MIGDGLGRGVRRRARVMVGGMLVVSGLTWLVMSVGQIQEQRLAELKGVVMSSVLTCRLWCLCSLLVELPCKCLKCESRAAGAQE